MTETTFSNAVGSLFANANQELTPDDGLPVSMFDDAQQHLGFRIPQPLRDYYSQTGNTEFNHSFNRFLAPQDFDVRGDYAIFCEENQCVVLYGFRISDAEQENPEVWQLNPTENKWYFDCKRMTSFLLKMVCWQAVCGGVSATAKGMISTPEFQQIESTFNRVEFGDIDHDYDLCAFHKDGVILCAFPDDGVCHLYCGCNDEGKMYQVADHFGLDML
ncbi:MAG: hypothetical protein NXI22_20630 [bacterium]|nr:hypothetical protein [bacterium]